jgi:hypothetical protein
MTTVKELRKEGKLEEALALALSNMENEPDNIWNKRSILWVYYDYLKKANEEGNIIQFYNWMEKIVALGIDADENVFLEQLTWQIGKIIVAAVKKMESAGHYADSYVELMVKEIMSIPFLKPDKGFSYMMGSLHKYYKDRWNYKEIMDWAGLENLTEADFEGRQVDGRTMMSVGEQLHIGYAKALLKGDVGPDTIPTILEGVVVRVKSPYREPVPYPKEELISFIEKLETLSERYPKMIYFDYYKAKLLILCGTDSSEVLEELLPFVRKKKDEFWAWDVLAEALGDDKPMVFSCYCRALQCQAPSEMLVGVREKMAALLIERGLYAEAKTEISAIVTVKESQGHKIKDRLQGWMNSQWYADAQQLNNNKELYKQYAVGANEMLFNDKPEQLILVDFVNSDKKILNFITEDDKTGFFKYERFIKSVKPGDLFRVRFGELSKESMSKILTCVEHDEEIVFTKFWRIIGGELRVLKEQGIGFVEDAFIPAEFMKSCDFKDGDEVQVEVIRSYNPKKKSLGWRAISPPSDPDNFVKADLD